MFLKRTFQTLRCVFVIIYTVLFCDYFTTEHTFKVFQIFIKIYLRKTTLYVPNATKIMDHPFPCELWCNYFGLRDLRTLRACKTPPIWRSLVMIDQFDQISRIPDLGNTQGNNKYSAT